jgi:glycosyltransferase involved in cell wall biosynthesis
VSATPTAVAPARASVAVCIPTYNQAHLLPRAVASAAQQVYDGRVEIWVSDDASTDGTADVLAQLQREYPELHVLAHTTNAGIPQNSSVVLRQPQTEFLVRLDSDDELLPGYVDRLAKLMEAEPRAGYAHTQILEIDEDGRPVRTRRLVRPSGYQDSETALRASLSGYRAAANIQMFRRAALERLNFYDGGPERGQDYDLAIRMADAGYGNIYVAETLASYRVWSDTAGLRSRLTGAQLKGYQQIFDNTFLPAWRRRGWNEDELTRQRNRLAASICATCFAPQRSAAEREELVVQLLRLGNGRGVRLRIRLCRLGFTPVVRYASALPLSSKRRAKALLALVRRIGRRVPHSQ